MSFESIRVENGKLHIDGAKSHDGKPILIEQVPPHPILVTVTGRADKKYDPPSEHLGKKLPNQDPVELAKLAVSYLDSLVTEAEALA